jgi:enoyl-CoA hydratase
MQAMSGPSVVFADFGAGKRITLNRPQALNALTLEMVGLITPRLAQWAGEDDSEFVIIDAAGDKAFCAGGDIRALYDWGRAGDVRALQFYAGEYRLNAMIQAFPKPYIAVMDGITMGGGVGLSVHGSHRIGTERLTFAMPETGIGFYPDVGGSYFLPRCPGQIGMYLALTGHRLKAADALYAGVIDAYVPLRDLNRVIEAISQREPPDKAISQFAADPGEAPLAAHRGEIDHAFKAASVEEIMTRLGEMGTDWADDTTAILAQKSPTSLKVTHRQIVTGAGLDFGECMVMEYRLACRFMAAHDFPEGIRAVVIDKDMSPQWQPAGLEDVTDEMVDAYFKPLKRDLDLS